MKRQDFSFELPEYLIAQYPLKNRSDSRLLVFDRKSNQYGHHHFHNLCEFLTPGDLLVLNNTRVIPARLYGTKETGGKVEFLFERTLSKNTFLAHAKASKALKAEMTIVLQEGYKIKIIERVGDLYRCELNDEIDNVLPRIGHIPLPPYISREDNADDIERYQTVYAEHNGSVAAPTAGLHFDNEMFDALRKMGVNISYTTLHVGSGTFRPVRSEQINEHQMHKEQFTISEQLVLDINATKANGKRVIAVGTTACRSLESAAQMGELKACRGETDIFIYPGYSFKICDGLITNFHLPESTLLMLVSAFMGHRQAMEMYQIAVQESYRFFSYGDASLLL